jgi:hypothetical protein
MGKELRQMVKMACCWVWRMRRIDNVVWTLGVSILKMWRARGRGVLNRVSVASQCMNVFRAYFGKVPFCFSCWQAESCNNCQQTCGVSIHSFTYIISLFVSTRTPLLYVKHHSNLVCSLITIRAHTSPISHSANKRSTLRPRILRRQVVHAYATTHRVFTHH